MTCPEGPDCRGMGLGLRLCLRTRPPVLFLSKSLLAVSEGSNMRQHVSAASFLTSTEGCSRYAATTAPINGRSVEQIDVGAVFRKLERVDRDRTSVEI